jgi:hypothetical protein
MQKKKHSGEELYGELGKAFNFTQGDLEANRAGFLALRQSQRIKSSILWFAWAMFIGTICFTRFVVLRLSYGNILEAVGMTAILMFIPFSILIVYWYLLRIDLRERLVRCKACKKEAVTIKDTSYYLSGTGWPFSISKKQFNLLDDAYYWVYYLPRSRKILSLEESSQGG